MKILVTAADHALGEALSQYLAPTHNLRLACCPGLGNQPAEEGKCSEVDLRNPEQAAEIVVGIDAIVHVAPFAMNKLGGHEAEQQAIEEATLGTYVLCQAAREAGVDRMIVIGTLGVYDPYPDTWIVDEQWRPLPAANAAQLAPYLAEHVVHAHAREGDIKGIALRFFPIGDDPGRNTRLEDALQAIECALTFDFGTAGYRWHVFNIAASPRFILRQARLRLGFQTGG